MNTKKLMPRLFLVWSLLLIPFLGSYFSAEVLWSTMDYVAAALLLSGVAFALTWIQGLQLSKKTKSLCIVIFVLFFLVLWAELAVGLFGSPIAGS